MAVRLGSRDRRRGDLGHPDVPSGRAGLALAHSDAPELGGREDRPRDEAALRRGVLAGEEVAQHPEIVPRGMRELRRSRDVARGVDAGRRRLEAGIDLDEAALGQLDPRRLQAQAFCDGSAPQGNEEARSRNLAGGRADDDSLAARGHAHRALAGAHRHALRGEVGRHLFGDVRVLPGKNALPALDEGHVRPEGRHHRGRLDADDSAAEDDEPIGDLGQAKRVLARPVGDVVQSLDRRNRGRRPRVDQNSLPLDHADRAVGQRRLDRLRPDEFRRSENEIQPGRGEHLLMRLDHAADHALLAGPQGLKVHSRRGEVGPGQIDPVRRGRANLGEPSRARDERFRRDAGDVDARPADFVPLDHEDFVALLRAKHGERLSGLSAADDHEIVFFGRACHHIPPYILRLCGMGSFPPDAYNVQRTEGIPRRESLDSHHSTTVTHSK